MSYYDFLKRFANYEIAVQIEKSPDFQTVCQLLQDDGWKISCSAESQIYKWATDVKEDFMYLVRSQIIPEAVTARWTPMKGQEIILASEIEYEPPENIVKEVMSLID